MEGWVDIGVGYILKWFTCPQTVIHPSSNHLIATWPGVEFTSYLSYRSNALTLLRHRAISVYRTESAVMYTVLYEATKT